MLIHHLHNITSVRMLNWLKCQLSYTLSCIGIVSIKHFPTFISIEAADFCMLHCPQCPVGITTKNKEDERNLFSPELLQKILDEIGQYLLTIIFHFQGEPLLNKQLPQLIKMAHDKGIYTMFSTNAQLLTPDVARQLVDSGIDKIIVSIDGFTQETYEQYRVGGNLQRALDGMKNLQQAKLAAKSKMQIQLQCLRLKTNESQWNWLQNHYKELGADTLHLKTAQFLNFNRGNILMPTDEKFSRYRKLADGTYIRKKRYRNFCHRLWSGCVIDAHGNVLPCCFDKNGRYPYGNLGIQTFRQCWRSLQARKIRRQVLKNRKKLPMCLNCTE